MGGHGADFQIAVSCANKTTTNHEHVILAILLESLGFPLEIVGLVAGVHAFNDMGNDHD